MNNYLDEFLKYKRYCGYKYKTEEIIINELKNFFKENNIEIITKEVAEKYARININRDGNTIARNIGVLREFSKYLKTKNIDSYQIPKKLYSQKTKKYVPYIFTKKEINLIFKNIEIISSSLPYSYLRHQTFPLIIRILYQTGMRIGEVLNLKIEDYDINDGCFILRGTKNNKERIIYLSDNLNILLSNYHKKFHNNENIYFFQIKNGKISESMILNNFRKALKLSNITLKARVHDLRFTFITRNIEKAVNEGKDLNVFLPYLQEYVGHSSIHSLEYYYKLTNNMLNNLKEKIEERTGNIIPIIGEENE